MAAAAQKITRGVVNLRSFCPLVVFVLAHVMGGCKTMEAPANDSGAAADGGGQTEVANEAPPRNDSGAAVDDGPVESGDASVEQAPNCLQALFAACPTDSGCYSHAPAGIEPTLICWANHVRAYRLRTGGCNGDGRIVLEVHKPDGSLCYTTEVTQGPVCESERFTWRDASGRVIATGMTEIGREMFTCEGSNEPLNCTDRQCRLGSYWTRHECQPGCPGLQAN